MSARLNAVCKANREKKGMYREGIILPDYLVFGKSDLGRMVRFANAAGSKISSLESCWDS